MKIFTTALMPVGQDTAEECHPARNPFIRTYIEATGLQWVDTVNDSRDDGEHKAGHVLSALPNGARRWPAAEQKG